MTASLSTTLTQAESRGFLGVLQDGEREALLASGAVRSFPRGTVLFHEHDDSDSVVVLLEGRVKVYSLTRDGKEVVFAFRQPGDVLGELAAVDGRPRSAAVSALEDVTASFVPAAAFRSYLEGHPRVALLLFEMLSARLRDADRKRVEFAAYDTVGRVAARLAELSAEHGVPAGEGVEITLPLSQDELAGWTGSSREAVGKALHMLRDLGWVETGRRRVTVLDLEALRRRAM